MDYWAETMQDDVYLIAADGWLEAARPRGIVEDKLRRIRETPDLTSKRRKYKMDLVPPELIVSRFFAAEREAIDDLQAAAESAGRELDEFIEEHLSADDGEAGLLAEAANDAGKVTKGVVRNRLKAIQGEAESDEEHAALTRCLELIDAESTAGRAVKDAQTALDEATLAQYAQLGDDEIKALVVEDKWFASIRERVEGEVQRSIHRLSERVQELEERYANPLTKLEQDVNALSATVDRHLKNLGLTWG